ncbi:MULTISPECIES: methyltransferase family protein [unclassified Clostridioides]|uniref:methyltransferase family protein n=1 Tax=unclassified Clostridioides TaxID=2635829 RepID=UPI001D11B094
MSFYTISTDNRCKTGLYHIVRNPAYTGSIMSLLGVGFTYQHVLSFITVLIICLICYSIRIHVEEKALKKQFEEEFQQYCMQTKYRLIP